MSVPSSLSNAQGMLNSTAHVGYVIQAWKDLIWSQDSEMNIIFDSTIDYQRASKAIRKNAQITGADTSKRLPILAFQVGPLQWDDESGIGLRSRTQPIICPNDQGGHLKLKAVQGFFNLSFIYYTRNLEDLNRFQIAYMTEEFISTFKRVPVTFPGGIKANYDFTYDEPFDEKILQTEDNKIMGVSGNIRVNGQFFSVKGLVQLIKKINAGISDFEAVNAVGEPIGTVKLSSITIEE